MKKTFFFLLCSCFLMSCASSKINTLEELNTLKSVVAEAKFEVVSNSANPVAFANVRGLENLLPIGSNLASINLIGIANYFKVYNNTLAIELPYYGEQRMSRGYNTDVGISFKGVPKNKKIKFDEKKNRCLITYSLYTGNENLNILLTLYPNKKSRIDINSSHRTPISYYGDWKILGDKN